MPACSPPALRRTFLFGCREEFATEVRAAKAGSSRTHSDLTTRAPDYSQPGHIHRTAHAPRSGRAGHWRLTPREAKKRPEVKLRPLASARPANPHQLYPTACPVK